MPNATHSPCVLGKIRRSKYSRAAAVLLAVGLLSETLAPLQALALTSGPSQPEADSFTPIETSDMVSPFTGDFSYNIPLLEIGGYPINLSYQSGVTMEQEATWAGLGWNVNVGSITRQMRGVPDEFWGDEIKRELNMKDNFTVGANVGINFEAFGFEPPSGSGGGQVGISVGMDISYNNYKGFNLGTSFAPSIGTKRGAAFGSNFSLGMSSSLDGMNISPNLSFSQRIASAGNGNLKAGIGFGLDMNSRTGLSNLTLSSNVRFEDNVTKLHYSPVRGIQVTRQETSASHTVFGGSIRFGGTTYTPQIDMPFETGAFTGTFKIGAAAWGGDFDLKVGGYGSLQRLKQKEIKTPAYGYFYEEKANGRDNAIMDFNREKDGSFTEFTPALPVTVHTHDVFNINAHGLSGTFRGFRNDLGFVHDNRMKTTSFDFTTGFELNAASLLDAGFDVASNTVVSESKPWRQQNKAEPYLKFKENTPNSAKENFHLKITGEPAMTANPAFENETGNSQAVQIPFEDGNTFGTKLDNKIKFRDGSSTALTAEKQRAVREPRNVSISYLTVKEAKAVSPRRQKYISPVAKDHHIAEITVIHPDGKRYVFGLAAYNKMQKEVTFAVGAGKYGNPVEMVGVGPGNNYPILFNVPGLGTLASTANNMGIDNYFDATTTPAYVHTWFLTEVYSPDYVDVTGDGPSTDDMGNYVVFNYGQQQAGGKITPDIADYRWRTPAYANSVSYNKGLYSDPTDDKANYIYGVKEVYFLHTIESKNQVAVFTLKDRQDGFGVTGEFGGPGGPALKAIDKISVYSREEYESSMVPTKTIFFGHDYSLCDNVTNNTSGEGKLTLNSVWFTYRNSARSKFSHYTFNYDTNPNYDDYRPTDRWGNHKPNQSVPANGPDNSEFPYVTQNTDAEKTQLQTNVRAWNLTEIGLPTGGSIKVDYEPDDYAYVQNRKAARMFNIIGAAENYTDTREDRLYKKAPLGGIKNYNYLFFHLEEGTESMSDQEIIDAYLPQMYEQENTYIYYRFFTNMNNGAEYMSGNTADKKNEYVSGYAEVDRSDPHFMGKVSGNIGYIKIKTVPVSDKPGGLGAAMNINPITKAAWQFSRINTPKYAFNQPDPDDTEFEVIVKLLAAADMVSQIINMFKGPNIRMLEHGFGSYFDTKRSWIRLNDPDGQKFGGGSRVSAITVSDNWDTMEPTEAGSSYTQLFEYKTAEGKSSGVASYEPMMGADENPFREPVFYPGKKNLLIPGDGFYQETPYGESFFPSPVVGYSRVVVKDKPVTGSSNSATGFTVQEFYTAKDYPSIASHTSIDNRRKKTNPLMALLKVDIKDFMRVSQGFVVELNDMHGKPKSKKIYAETPTEDVSKLISSEEYVYFDAPYDGQTRRLQNDNIPVIDDKGRLSSQKMASEYDIVVDMREQKTRTYNVTVAANLAYFQNGPVPVLVPTVFPGFSSEVTMFRSAVTTKVIYKYGMLKETIVTDLGSRVSKQNLAFDPLTGDPLLTQVNSEFDDPQYNLTLPARWMHDGMGAAYRNIGYTFMTTPSNYDYANSSILPGTDPDKHLFPGDELVAFNSLSRKGDGSIGNEYTNRFWVAADDGGTKYLINRYGAKIPVNAGSAFYLKVIRSGARNMNAVPTSQTASLEKPVNTTGTVLELNAAKKVLNSSATVFAEQWAVNAFNSKSSCEKICTLEGFGQMLVSWLNRMLQEGRLGDGQPYPLSDYYSVYDNPFIDENNCTEGTITTGIYDDGGYQQLAVNIAGCEIECPSVVFYVHPNSPVYTDVFLNPGTISHFSPSVITTDCRGTEIPDFDEKYMITAVLADGREVMLVGYGLQFCSTKTCRSGVRQCPVAGQTVNPYVSGNLGNWRTDRSFTYHTLRQNQSMTAAADVRGGGYFAGYTPFWAVPVSSTAPWTQTTQLSPAAEFWQWTSQATGYGSSGAEVENRVPATLVPYMAYSSALYGYHNLLATAVVANARYREIAYDGFEDYYSQAVTNNCYRDHFRFEGYENSVVTEAAHTGKYSLKVPAQTTYTLSRDLVAAHVPRSTRNVPYVLESGDFLGLYSPPANSTDYKFVVSFWAKPAAAGAEEFDYTGIGFTFTTGTGNYSVTPVKTRRVEGWQKFEYVITANLGAPATAGIQVKLENNRADAVYFDDLRIHPFNANMKTYVYDINTLKPMAELDENNFATFYEYDEEGSLVRVKKETERGIVTLKEIRKNAVKQVMN